MRHPNVPPALGFDWEFVSDEVLAQQETHSIIPSTGGPLTQHLQATSAADRSEIIRRLAEGAGIPASVLQQPEGAITTAGGWCAPMSDPIMEIRAPHPNVPPTPYVDFMPEVQVRRGGIRFDRPTGQGQGGNGGFVDPNRGFWRRIEQRIDDTETHLARRINELERRVRTLEQGVHD